MSVRSRAHVPSQLISWTLRPARRGSGTMQYLIWLQIPPEHINFNRLEVEQLPPEHQSEHLSLCLNAHLILCHRLEVQRWTSVEKCPNLANNSVLPVQHTYRDNDEDSLRMTLTDPLAYRDWTETTCEAPSSIRVELQKLRKVSQPWNRRGNRVESMSCCSEHTYISYTTRDSMQSPCSMERLRSSGNSASHGMIATTEWNALIAARNIHTS